MRTKIKTQIATLRVFAAACLLLLTAPASAQTTSGPTAPAPQPGIGQGGIGQGGTGQGGTGAKAAARDEVRLLLSGYHGLPPKAAFEAIEGVKEHLYSFAHETGGLGLHRDRALAALAYFPDDSVFRLYTELLEADSTRQATLHRVMRFAAGAFGQRALPLLMPYLGDDDLQLRLTAVEAIGAIGAIGSEIAIAALAERARVETHPLVKKRLERVGRQLR